MNIKDFENLMKEDLKYVYNAILKENNYILPISAKSRSGAEISDYLEDGFVEFLNKNPHPRIYNQKGSPKGSTKNPYDFCFNYRNADFNFDDLIWGDIKATKKSYADSNPDLGTPTKMIKFMLDGHFYLVFVFVEYDATEDGQTIFLPFENGEYVHVMFLKDISSTVRINPKPQFQVNIHEPEEYRTKEEFIDLFLRKYKESVERIMKIQMKKKETLDKTFDEIKKIQLNEKKDD